MHVLIVESREELARIWKTHLENLGVEVTLAQDQESAANCMANDEFHVIVLDLVLESGSALAVSDLAHYRQPRARVVFVTSTSFFADGSIFLHCANACAFLPSSTPPADLATMIGHHAHMVQSEGYSMQRH